MANSLSGDDRLDRSLYPICLIGVVTIRGLSVEQYPFLAPEYSRDRHLPGRVG